MKKEKQIVLRTKRLELRPMNIPELERRVVLVPDPEDSKAYAEMLSLSRAHPEYRLWYTAWAITRKSDGRILGDLCFKGPAADGEVEIGYGLEEPYWNQGYMTEAADALIRWALSQPGVYAVTAQTLPGNLASQRVLEKLDFHPDGMGEEGPRFRRERKRSAYILLYTGLGLCLGVAIGTAAAELAVGLCAGGAVGTAMGALMDAGERERRSRICGRKSENNR